MLVGYSRATRPCTLINTQNGALRAPLPIAASLLLSSSPQKIIICAWFELGPPARMMGSPSSGKAPQGWTFCPGESNSVLPHIERVFYHWTINFKNLACSIFLVFLLLSGSLSTIFCPGASTQPFSCWYNYPLYTQPIILSCIFRISCNYNYP
jgi:hypothetical protein